MSQKNMGRLAQDMKREVIAIISRLKDPRLEGGLLTVTRLDVTPDLDVAKVYVSVMGREDGPTHRPYKFQWKSFCAVATGQQRIVSGSGSPSAFWLYNGRHGFHPFLPGY